ncbi:MAG: ABC transporter permease [Bacteroidota bacterium]
MNWQRIKAILIKEFGQLFRDKHMLPIIFIAPILQLTLFGFAASLDVKNISIVLLDYDNSKVSREIISKISNSGYFNIEYVTQNYKEIGNYLDEGKASVGVIIPNGFEKKLLRNESSTLQLLIDGSEGNTAAIAQSYIQQIINQYSIELLSSKIGKISRSSITAEIRVWYNPALKSRNFIVPGVLVILLMLTTMSLTSMAIVKEREIGTLEQLMVTPIKPTELMIGKILPYVLIGLINITVVLLVINFGFGIEIKGSIFLFYILTGIFLLNSLGLGLLISTIAKTQQEALMFGMMFIFQPMLNLSGFVFAIDLMPKLFQFASYLIPVKYYLIIVRSIILKGVGISELWSSALALLILGSIILGLSIKRFHKKLE